MKKTKKATSLLEAMIVLMIIVVGITGLYGIYSNSQKLSLATKNRIEAIEIAREGIEAMKNIRDTNWKMFGGDKSHCYNTFNYDSKCIGDNGTNGTKYIKNNKSYIIYQNSDNKWELLEKPTGNFGSGTYRNNFRVYKKNGYYTQTGTTSNPTIYTREIKIKNLTNTGFWVHSVVQWADSTKKGFHKIDIPDLISNRAKN